MGDAQREWVGKPDYNIVKESVVSLKFSLKFVVFG